MSVFKRLSRWTAWFALCAAGPAWALPDEVAQEGLLLDVDGLPLEGRHQITVRMYAQANGGAPLFLEVHPNVDLFEGYYFVAIGSRTALDRTLFTRAQTYFSVSVDDGPELLPRTPMRKVPAAMVADVALSVKGDIDVTSVSIGGQRVINDAGRWVGDPTGLTGPAGPAGAVGPAGPAGGNGSPDTPAQVRDKLIQADGAGSGIDSDRLDGIDASQFMRSDRDTGSVGQISAGNGLVVSAAGRGIAQVVGGAANDAGRQLQLLPQDDVSEGGHLHLRGAANDQDWAIDVQQGNLRIFEPLPSSGQARRDGNVFIFRDGGQAHLNVAGDLSAAALNGKTLNISGRQIIDGNGRLNQAQWDQYAQLRVITNTVGTPDHNLYVNYPNRADSRTYLYNDPVVDGTLTTNGNVLLGGGYIYDSGITYTCESGGGALGNCPNGGFWTFDRIVLEHDQAAVPGRMNATPPGSMNVAGQIQADGQIATNSDLRAGGNVYLGGTTLFDSGVTYTCEAGGGALGACPNSGQWTFDKLVIEHNHADVPARMAAIPNGSINVEGQIRADGAIISLNNVVATGQLQAGASSLQAGQLRLGAGANERLTAAQLATLVGGGNADALHTHAGLGGNKPWINVGNLNDFFNIRGNYPFTHYEFGVTYNTQSILPVVFSGWNGGWRVTGQYDYLIGDRFPWEGGNSFTHGGSVWVWDTQGAADNACNNAGSWYQYYYLKYGNPNPHNSHGSTYFWASNGCSIPTLYVREL